MAGRRRRRPRERNGGFSRRRLLLLLGGSSILGALAVATDAFSTTRTPRLGDVNAADDDEALLGLDVSEYVDAGEDDQDLVTITNNTPVTLTVSVDLADPSKGSVSPASFSLPSTGSQTVTADVLEDVPGGEDALTVNVSATDDESVDIDLSRSLGVRTFLRNLEDKTQYTNALYYLSYRPVNVDDFDYYEVVVENLGPSRDDLPVRTYTSSDFEGVFRIPETDTDGGAEGDTYEFDMRVYDDDGLALRRIMTDVADGQDPSGNDDIGGAPDDPVVVDFTITDETLYDNGDFTVDYVVDNIDELLEVRVTFDNLSNAWADQTKTSTSAPTGTATYQQGGVEGDTYEITVEVVNTNGIVTDSLTKTDVADGDDLGGGGGGGSGSGAEVVDFTIADTTKNDNGKFTVDYEVTSDPDLDYVEVSFDNLSNAWADQTKTSNQEPTGSVNYNQGGVESDTYEITVRTVDTNGDVTDSLTKTDVADGVDP